ncbi:hypothetical protein [Desulfosarcina sp.]|uniref:hypothetical protein n=1 Tax=Desulfosarcina sp. TaxID=2027861 RepID=UPI00356A7FCB
MKNLMVVLAVVLSMGIIVQPVLAVDVTGTVDLNSAYVWRGMTFNDGWVAQPSIDITRGGFGLNVWGNFDIDDYNDTLDSGEFSEIDLTASYAWTLGALDVGVGYIEYLYPTTDVGGLPGTRELYVSLGMALPAGFSLAWDVYRDIDEIKEWYTSLGLTYAYDINDKLNLAAGASMGWAGDDYCADDSAGFYDYNLSVTLGYAIDEAWSVSAFIKYTDALDDDNLADVANGGLLDVNTYGGVSVSYAF